MDSLTFLYIALGGGFLLLVFFLCIALFHLIRILKDVGDASDSVKDTAEKMNESVGKITEKINDATEQLTEYVVKPFTVIQYIADKARPMIEMLQKKGEEWGMGEEEEAKPKKKRRFGRKK
jgi:hypothetical protein